MINLGPKDSSLTNFLIYNTFFTCEAAILMHAFQNCFEISEDKGYKIFQNYKTQSTHQESLL